ncbi:hypothetical protein [Maribacter algicola]|uniref:hypothetical protein n=1 Tax=Maribacter algicola TaxID=2498892 RepID=UPI000F6459FB|nr:hypothetical protein [Maribacter algicola]
MRCLGGALMDRSGRRNSPRRDESAVQGTTHVVTKVGGAQQFPWPYLIFWFIFHQGKMNVKTKG